MNMKEELARIEGKLEVLGDLNLVAGKIDSVNQFLESLREAQGRIEALVPELEEQKEEIKETLEESSSLVEKTQQIHDESREQLGYVSGAKLSGSFDKIKEDLKEERDYWFGFIIKGVAVLICVVIAVIAWESVTHADYLGTGFFLKLLVTSPVVYFIVFSTREFSRKRNLVEEYRFKSAIAWSFEAYRKILDESFGVNDQAADIRMAEEKLKFALQSVSSLYSSPMANIRGYERRENEIRPDDMSILKATTEE